MPFTIGTPFFIAIFDYTQSMPLVGGKVFTAAQTGHRLETVACEKCGTHFFYELVRVGVGKGSAVYSIGQTSAKHRAQAAADVDLTNRLDREAELVPCPKCNWVNTELIQKYRARQYRRAPLLIGLVIVAGIVIGPLISAGLMEMLGYNSRVPNVVMQAINGVCLSSPVWILLIRRQLRNRIDPNITYPRSPVVPPGTPPALVEQPNPLTGEMELAAVPRQESALRANSAWAMYRPGQVQFQPFCCRCMAPAETFYRSPMPVNDHSELRVPLCSNCRTALKRRWWQVTLMTALLLFGITFAALSAASHIDSVGRWFGSGMGAFLGLILGVAVAGIACRPYRFKAADSDRGIAMFAAENPQFTALLIQQINQSNGLGKPDNN